MNAIVLTGGIASGKSTVTRYLRSKGYPVIDLDVIAHQVVQAGSPGLALLVQHFGQNILSEDGELNRAMMGQMLFTNPKVKEKVNQLLHPLIFSQMDEEIEAERLAGSQLVFLDIPLFFESSSAFDYNQVWVVYVEPEVQIERLMARNQLTRQQAMDRINSQMSLAEKAKRADQVLDNSSSPAALYATVDKLLERL
ncbi:dephospho-CoA kinase [Ignavigranum ruoffiae]|uniref:Dephospho-CoA kinase n=1 Tax=Ignavigranum ruoffiae TaxID=89093 RepID=A0A1H9FUR6_9LACT|nr:dephospho-CoA kinase [Ignavigranum ruoffiae]SEQ41624.1 dephospho-CoA kinase [Ignavigranum ruoffiae]